MDTEYLKATVGDVLAVGLAEIAVVKPTDPVEYLSRWLANHKKIQERAVEVGTFREHSYSITG